MACVSGRPATVQQTNQHGSKAQSTRHSGDLNSPGQPVRLKSSYLTIPGRFGRRKRAEQESGLVASAAA